jgi:hypothetical protein
MTYLADTSAVWRMLRGQVGEPSLLHADGDFASIAKVRPGIAMIRVD